MTAALFSIRCGIYNQTDITVGIRNETGTIGLQVAFNVNYPINNLATRITNPPLTGALMLA